MKRILSMSASALALLLLAACGSTQKVKVADYESDKWARKQLVVMSYNVENFFNPEDDPNKNDDDFSPNGSYRWTEDRMRAKALRLSKAIVSANGWDLPDVVGLCEVEGPGRDEKGNAQMSGAELLVRYGNMDKGSLNYVPVCLPSPDKRGIATAMIYNANTMTPISFRNIQVSDTSFITRDVLYAVMTERKTNQTFHFLVNHWPSKMGGAKTQGRRMAVAKRVRAVCDSILSTNADANIVLLGDFNDEAHEPSVSEWLGAKSKCDTAALRNLSSDCLPDMHSYKYHGKWSTIDHIIVSAGVCKYGRPAFSVAALPFLLEPDDRNTGYKPFRTYLGKKFNAGQDGRGGYSDHLPVLIRINLTKE